MKEENSHQRLDVLSDPGKMVRFHSLTIVATCAECPRWPPVKEKRWAPAQTTEGSNVTRGKQASGAVVAVDLGQCHYH